MLTKMKRTLAVATAAAIALTAVSVTPAAAGRRDGVAAAAAFAAVVGTIATIAIAEQRRSDWEHQRYYGGYRGYGSGYRGGFASPGGFHGYGGHWDRR